MSFLLYNKIYFTRQYKQNQKIRYVAEEDEKRMKKRERKMI